MRGTLTTARGAEFTIISARVGSIFFRVSTGKEREVHTDHIAMILHWMRFKGKAVQGVDSGRHSVRALVGEEGDLVACSVCERNPAYIWGILAALPDVVQDGMELKIESDG